MTTRRGGLLRMETCGHAPVSGHVRAARGSIPLVLLTSHFPDRHRRRHRAARRGTRDVFDAIELFDAGAKARLVAYDAAAGEIALGVGSGATEVLARDPSARNSAGWGKGRTSMLARRGLGRWRIVARSASML